METRIKKYNQLSPERAKVWTEKSPKYLQTRKVAVIYYLCRNRQLEHPHFMEVPLSSPEGLYLRDVINRLKVLRGRVMATLYSWSCKRSYKNGFVWHDLCEDDLILPAHGNEYVLKGSELFEESTSSKDPFSSIGNVSVQPLKQLPDPASSQSQDDSSSSSSMNGKEMKNSQEDDLSLSVIRSGSSGMSPDSGGGKNSWGGCLSLTEYKVYKTDGLSDASTQTEENISRPNTRETCTRGVSTDDGTLEPECSQTLNNEASNQKQHYDPPQDSVSPPTLSSSASSSGGKTETLESLIRADASKINSFQILEEEEIRMPTNARLKATNVLLQLISCGSISVKDHSFGLIPSYKPRFSHSKFPSPLFSTTVMLGDLNCLSENPRMVGLRLEDKEYFSGSLIETKMLQGEGLATLKRSSSYNADRTSKQLNSIEDKDELTSGRSKCIPRVIKASLSKQARNEPMKSPNSDRPRTSSDGVDSSQTVSPTTSNDSGKRITEPCSGRKQSKKLDSFREEEEDIVKIEERLASGARFIIWSKSNCNSTGVGST